MPDAQHLDLASGKRRQRIQHRRIGIIDFAGGKRPLASRKNFIAGRDDPDPEPPIALDRPEPDGGERRQILRSDDMTGFEKPFARSDVFAGLPHVRSALEAAGNAHARVRYAVAVAIVSFTSGKLAVLLHGNRIDAFRQNGSCQDACSLSAANGRGQRVTGCRPACNLEYGAAALDVIGVRKRIAIDSGIRVGGNGLKRAGRIGKDPAAGIRKRNLFNVGERQQALTQEGDRLGMRHALHVVQKTVVEKFLCHPLKPCDAPNS